MRVEKRPDRDHGAHGDVFGLVAVLPNLRPRVHQECGEDGHDEVRQHDLQVPQRTEIGSKGRNLAERQCADDDVPSENLKADGRGNDDDDRARREHQ